MASSSTTTPSRASIGILLVTVGVCLALLTIQGGDDASHAQAPVGITPTGEPPTPTPGAGTAAATPRPINLTLRVRLQRPNAPPPNPAWAVPVRLSFHPPGDANTISAQYDLALDQNGQWSGALSLPAGTYDVRLKNLHTLRNVRRSVAVSDMVIIDMGELQEGDADSDNRVRTSDFAVLRAAYFTSQGEAGFDPRADFDEDHRIRTSDFALLRNNYFKSGDIEVTGVGTDMFTAATNDAAGADPTSIPHSKAGEETSSR